MVQVMVKKNQVNLANEGRVEVYIHFPKILGH